MPTWIKASIAALVLIGIYVVVAAAGMALHRRHLRRVLAGRDPATALATCIEAFPDVERDRVVLAYLWVQELVDIRDAPIRADDDLWRDLRIDQGSADDKFESSHEWKGKEARFQAGDEPVQTVRDLMREVLGYGYEAYRNRRNRRAE